MSFYAVWYIWCLAIYVNAKKRTPVTYMAAAIPFAIGLNIDILIFIMHNMQFKKLIYFLNFIVKVGYGPIKRTIPTIKNRILITKISSTVPATLFFTILSYPIVR